MHSIFHFSDLIEYVDFFKSKGITLINAACTGMGLLTMNGPQDWHPAIQQTKDICKQASEWCKEKGVKLGRLTDVLFLTLCPISFLEQLAIKYALSRKEVATNLISVTNLEFLKQNLEWAASDLTPKEKEKIETLNKTFFSNLVNSSWENLEVKSYWEQMKRAGTKQDTDVCD